MTFSLPTENNVHTSDPDANARRLTNIGSPSGVQAKTAGNLPISLTAGQFTLNTEGNVAGIGYEFQASQASYDVSSETKLLVWHAQSNAPNRIQIDSLSNEGVTLRLYSGSGSMPSDYREFIIGGNDTPMSACISGQYPFVIDLNDTTNDTETGTFDNTDVTSYSFQIRRLNLSGNGTAWIYMGSMYVLDTVKTSSATPTFTGSSNFQQAVDLIQGFDYTDKLGNWIRQTGDVIFIDMPFRIGDNSTSTQFTDQGNTIISPVSNDTSDPRNRLTVQAMRTYLNLRNNASDTAVISGTYIWGTRAGFDWDQDDAAVVTFNNPTFTGMGTITFGSSITGPATFDNTNEVILNDTGVDLDGSVFKNTNGSHSLDFQGGAMNIADMRFETYSGKHAILIDTAGTYNFSNVFFDQSGTNDIETTHASGTVTINISDGGVTPTVTETGAGAVVVNNNVSVSVTINDSSGSPIENARVEITATETVGTITTGDILLTGLTNVSGLLETTTFNYEAAFDPSGLDIQVKVRQGTNSPFKKPFTGTGLIAFTGYSTTISLLDDE
tara:strand:+ start:714 stop:2375 length:1662 start_codon:yes stop_codon:yes gene_type:complete